MKLIVVLVALALERYFAMGHLLRRPRCLTAYVSLLDTNVRVDTIRRGWLGILTVLLPLLVVVFLLDSVLSDWLSGVGLLEMLFALVILLYCFGPEDQYHQLRDYLAAEKEEGGDKQQLLAKLLPGGGKTARDLTKMIFRSSYQQYFAPIFWFVVLGPFGVVLYRLSIYLHRVSSEGGQFPADAKTATALLKDILDWLPARMMGLVYALVGNFQQGTAYWLRQAGKQFKNGDELVVSSAGAAADIAEGTGDLAENRYALEMTYRAVMVVLVIIAVFTLGSWIR